MDGVTEITRKIFTTSLLIKQKNTKMKQGNPTKRFGLIALIGAMLAGMTARPEGVEHKDLVQRRTYLLTNGGVAPMPQRMMNQRQRRKRNRQTNCF